jgi:prepilin-type processing-associated H-X9-DG protein
MLVVVAVLVILAALFYPVYTSAIVAAKQIPCIHNFHSVSKAERMYMDEYSDRFPPTNYHAYVPERVDPSDRTWVQLVSPYATSMDVFECPADTGRSIPAKIGPADDIDAAPSDDWGEFYTRSLRTNMGLNYIYLAPLLKEDGVWRCYPLRASEVGSPARTLLYVDSIWGRDKVGRPFGGGQWIVVPPCRYSSGTNGLQQSDSFPPVVELGQLYVRIAPLAWDNGTLSGNRFGGAWPWHGGRFTVGFVDLHVAALNVEALTAGCEVRRQWGGLIHDRHAYIWDLQD